MARASIRTLQYLLASYRVTHPNFVPTVVAVAVGSDKSLRLVANVTVNNNPAISVATDAGKVKVFGDIDAVVRAMSKIAESSNGKYEISVDTGDLFASSVPTDIVASYEATVIRLGKAKVKQQAVSTALSETLTLMTGWENGNAAQVARKAEVTEQYDTVSADINAIDAEVARLQALIAG